MKMQTETKAPNTQKDARRFKESEKSLDQMLKTIRPFLQDKKTEDSSTAGTWVAFAR